MTILLTALAFVAVFTFAVIVLTVRNAKRADELSKLNTQLAAITLLRDAIKHLEPLGSGSNLEYSNAREILEIAVTRVAFEN